MASGTCPWWVGKSRSDLIDEIERLRKERGAYPDVLEENSKLAVENEGLHKRIKNLGTDLDRKIVTITRQRQRIEQLENERDHYYANEAADRHTIRQVGGGDE